MNGLDNEYEFVMYLNGRKVKNLSSNFKNLINKLFYNINDETTLKCWRNHYKEQKI